MPDMELEHHGVKGMHWGVRRTPEQMGKKIRNLEKKSAKNDARVEKALLRRDRYEARAFNAKSKALRKGNKRAAKRYDKELGKLMSVDSYIYKMRYKTAKNGEKIDSFKKTIKSLNNGDIERGKGFAMRYVDGDYKMPTRIGAEDTNWLLKR